ncbi:two-component system sensor histidine kinase NtrB [Falsirhodobacter halotolerans]|uniref:two-component system sensor histidine kinase NtrB n=1 Tax=Falsirhodobacter halotolerans TaxID=1146892 RepID=UPI001FCF84C1|nr:PAS domain S-box protein [Falsirhodobacter halotolerans]
MPDSGPAIRHRLDLLSLVPLVAILALVALVAGVVWVIGRNEAEQARVKLATDALWVEQTLRFQMSVDEDMLARLALEAAGGAPPASLDARARLHLANNPEIMSVVWHDASGARLRTLPGAGAPDDPALVALLTRTGARSARPIYGDVRPDGTVAMGLAIAGGGGSVTATISLGILLDRHIPWWIAEQYGVRIFGSNDAVHAARQRLQPKSGTPSHSISFDPPLSGTFLGITAYDAPRPFRSTLLMAAIGALATFAILALLVLFRTAGRRRAAEERWRGESAFRRSMEESLTVGLRAKDHEGRVLYVNSAFCNLVGWEAADLVGQAQPMPYWDHERLPETEARQSRLKGGGAIQQSFETRFRHRDGRGIDVQVYEAPLIDAQGVHRGWMGSVIDLTEQKRADRMARAQDEALARTGRLVTLGEMASTLAHELNQPLAAIASYAAGMANLMEREGTDPALLREANRKLVHQADRAGQIIRHIQDLVKKRAPRFAPTDLAEVVTGTVGFMSADARQHRVTLRPRIDAAPVVQADGVLLEQMLINLIRNGMEAMADTRTGDVLTVRLDVEADEAVIEVDDQGAGIAEEILGRLFDAFATTKPQGMGMGLKICRSIVELHRGALSIRPGPKGGTIFRIALPLMSDARELS